jgi:hypothetical protein
MLPIFQKISRHLLEHLGAEVFNRLEYGYAAACTMVSRARMPNEGFPPRADPLTLNRGEAIFANGDLNAAF